MNTQQYWRQLDICDPERLKTPITIIGAGAVGSAVCYNLAKMGCSDITVFDGDTLAEHNVSNQFCDPSKIGVNKAESLRAVVHRLTGTIIKSKSRMFESEPVLSFMYESDGAVSLRGIVICAVDSMDVRADIWKSSIRYNINVSLYIDPRMGAEFGRLYAFNPCQPDAIDMYEETLYPSSEAEQLPCSAKAIIYCPTILAGYVAAVVKAHAVGKPYPHETFLNLADPFSTMFND